VRTTVIIPPVPVVSLEDAKAQVKPAGDGDDALIGRMVSAATAYLDGPDGWLGRALGQQTLEVAGDLFACRTVALPFQPVTSIVSVRYDDTHGVEQVADPASYLFRGAALSPAWGTSWPATRRDEEPVRVRYRAGYGALPEAIRAAILMMVEAMYEGTAGAVAFPPAAESLLTPFRLYA
jgi:uncharacterized phiE125 gp8 family phage protein